MGTGRPLITTTLPAPQPRVSPQQAGDIDVTSPTIYSQELDPFSNIGGTAARIAFASNGTDANADGRIDNQPLAIGANYNLWIMRQDGSEQVQVTSLPGDEREPAYDSSGNLFAFTNNQTGVWQIYTINIATTTTRQITTGPRSKRHPTWSPDENWLAYSQQNPDGSWDIYKTRSDGSGTPIQLTTDPGDETDPAWRPGSNLIAYTGDAGGVTRIFVIDEQAADPPEMLSDGGDPDDPIPATVDDQQPAWEWNGATLVFASNRYTDADTTRNFNIWRMGSSGEVLGASAVLAAEASAADTFSNLNPALTVDLARQEVRTVYESNRQDIAGGNRDLWVHLVRDSLPPTLTSTPSVLDPLTRLPNRLPSPGADVLVTVPVSDVLSGVLTVTAYFKDPDRKIYAEDDPASFDAGFVDGIQQLELDCRTVGSVPLDDTDADGVWEGVYTTQVNAHDYIVDIEATDNAGNRLRYDDIYGFSTKIFTPTGRILFVNDYCEGQEFIGDLAPYSNDFPIRFPVESYYTDNPGDNPQVFNVDSDSIAGVFGIDYDVWRIICRGRIPDSVYQIYLPSVEFQLEPEEAVSDPAGAQATRRVPVSTRMVIWAAPHTGNVWVGLNSGSLVDATTQADLTNYLSRGGKLFLSGQDIAWALTRDGTQFNTFLNSTLHAQFVADEPGNALGFRVSIGVGTWRVYNTSYSFTATGQGGDPITGTTWGGAVDGDDAPTNLQTPRVLGAIKFDDGWKLDAAEWSVYPDQIAVQAPATKIYGYGRYDAFNFAGPDAGLRYQDAVTGQQLVYLPFGFESIHRGYHTTNNYKHCKNHRSHLLTNTYIWMTTGTFQGRVLGLGAGPSPGPLTNPNPIVRVLQGGQVRYAVRCQDDGTYIVNGIAPGGYVLEAVRPGYDIDHFPGSATTHAAMGPVIVDFVLNQSQPGAISGTVTSLASGATLAGVQVSVFEAVDDGSGTLIRGPEVTGSPVTTGVDGTYSLGGLSPGSYFVEADGTAINYGVEEKPADVVSGSSTTVDFALPAAPGTLAATVIEVDALDNFVANIPGAVVRVYKGANLIATSGPTDASGKVNVSLSPDNYTARGTAAGFGQSASQGVVITSGGTTPATFRLQRENPGLLSGRLVSARTGQPIGGIPVRLQVGGVDVAPAVTSQSTFTDPGGGATPYNYRFTTAPTGQVDVVPDAPGFTVTPPSRSVQIVTGQETTGVNFTLSSLHTFPQSLLLMSTPYGYEYDLQGGLDVNDPAALLGIVPSELLMATYMPLLNRYALYEPGGAGAPADHFRLGRGYWLRLSGPADLTREGDIASDPQPVLMQTGWNMIGNPYLNALDLTRIQVEDQYGLFSTFTQAAAAGKLQPTIFAYVLGGYRTVSMMQPWVGYWIKVNEPLTFYFSQSAVPTAAQVSAAAEGWGVPTPPDGWLLPLVVSSGACVDAATFLGESRAATDDFDFTLDLNKPPVPDMQPYVYAALSGDQAVDVRRVAPKQSWDLVVRTNQVGSQVTLRWPDMTGLPANVRPVLEDLATNQRVYMRTSTCYQFIAGETDRQLRVTVNRGEAGGALVSALAASPGAGVVALSYNLGCEAAVTVEIRNISGRLVRRLLSATQQAAGAQALSWNGRNESGAAVPAGRYLITVSAAAVDGRMSQALAGVWLAR